jgi:hypothetical protein
MAMVHVARQAFDNVVGDRPEHAIDVLESVDSDRSRTCRVDRPYRSLFQPLGASPRFVGVLRQLAERAA